MNAILPGAIDTPMIGGPDFAAVDRASHIAKLPVSRIGEPAEVARLALFLGSDESAYCTGAEFVIDGGATAA